MAIVSRTSAKAYFETGDKPTQSQFGDFIDSALFYEDTSDFGRSLVSASSAISARSLLGGGNVGSNLFTAITTASGQTQLGGGIVGRQIFEAITTASGRNALDAQPLNTNLTAFANLSGSENKIPYFTGAGAMALGELIATTTARGSAFLTNPITIANNATTPNTDTDFTAGIFQFSDGTGQAVSTAMTKRLQSSGSWSAGAAGNMLLTGARANSSTYHLFAIHNPTTGVSDYGALLGVAGTAPDPTASLPSGYTKYQRIASVLTDGSGNIRAGIFRFSRDGSYVFKYNTSATEINSATLSTSSALQAITIPLGINVYAFCALDISQTSGGSSTNVYSTAQDYNKTTITTYTLGIVKVTSYTNSGRAKPAPVLSNTSAQIWYATEAFGGTGATHSLYTEGWQELKSI